MTRTESSVRLPDSVAGYVANDLAIITGIIHLLLAPQFINFSQTLGTLFLLNGLGFLGGIALYLTNYWRRELYLVAAGYALVTFIAFFVYGGFEGFVSAFYMRGSLNWNAVGAKTAEVLLIFCSLYLYTDSQ
ncbi:DUF7475 family protein [Halobacterium noricense]|uniref:DUF7475 family protein n=1 Tax=Halobacterium noricense TaxID=223182 RepID=UPI001E2E6988|nr:hypothetical protein [Halobacterium noricense]UHH26677.1 hypothetical protein LT974_07030 [Halobacterium noricense]